MTSYQAILQVHQTRGHHVVFLFTRSGIEKYNKMSCYFLFNSYNNIKLHLSDTLTRIFAYSLGGNFNSFYKVNLNFKRFVVVVVFIYTAPYKNKTKQRGKIVRVWVRKVWCKPGIHARIIMDIFNRSFPIKNELG